MIVLGVETSCDETAVALVQNGKTILSDVVYTQIKFHEKYGGVVPEVASRRHVQKILTVFEEALIKANLSPKDIDVVAVTTNPGLIGSLLVGLNAAHTFAYANDIPCVDINHLHGHIYANYIESDFHFPVLALIVSGGHTELILMRDHYEFELLGQTLDDAVGEAYDKVGRVMGLTYPAGVKVDRLAQSGKHTYSLPLVYLDKNRYDFSFSGIKSAVLNLINTHQMKNEPINIEDLATSFQESVVQVLVDKTLQAAQEYKVSHIIMAGGVAANSGLRKKMGEVVACHKEFILTYPSLRYCTDNAVMIAVAGYFKAQKLGIPKKNQK
ncbi:MAG: tRNA (adenosine(37)-N6)-threonylcarbamoyltransferase complex transferase subunit TsaD [Bacilli bacterium]|nr:tRNA (adenosine(37)-N6)-threonylcarbamoyltransferase complex transferase subunit TsaD [Bacilli bacterium]